VAYASGKGEPKDVKRAVEVYQKACDGGETFGCANLGWMYDYGKGVSKDKKRAVALYQKACEGGDQWGCRQERRTRVAHAE
jgi:hypothetical protein